MLQHLSTRPPTTRPRSPNPQPHGALFSVSCADFYPILHSFLSPCVILFFLQPFHQKKKDRNQHLCFLVLMTCYTCLLQMQKLLSNGCLQHPKASVFGHLMA